MADRLNGKTALVTGATGRLGAAIGWRRPCSSTDKTEQMIPGAKSSIRRHKRSMTRASSRPDAMASRISC